MVPGTRQPVRRYLAVPKGVGVGWILLILIVAILFGLLGLIVQTLKWILIVAGILFLIGVIAGIRRRS